jgi:exosortase family protein XrtF
MILSAYYDKWKKVPVAVRKFIVKAIAILVIWKIVYLCFLQPTRLLDRPLSYSVGSSTTWLLNATTHSHDFTTINQMDSVAVDRGMVLMPLQKIFFHDRDIVNIEDGCNALELFILYAGFIICMPAKPLRKVLFITGGILAIHVVNIIRCAGIAYIIIYHPRYADFAHHYVFTFVVYSFIIALWLIFSKKLDLTNGEGN